MTHGLPGSAHLMSIQPIAAGSSRSGFAHLAKKVLLDENDLEKAVSPAA
jgi:hypothetical protein